MSIVTYLFIAMLCGIDAPVTAQQKQPVSTPKQLPSGTYYIIHASSSGAYSGGRFCRTKCFRAGIQTCEPLIATNNGPGLLTITRHNIMKYYGDGNLTGPLLLRS